MYERLEDDVNLLQERVDYAGISETVLTHQEAHPDERLREAVGEEKLIMHSMLTGQNFILERM